MDLIAIKKGYVDLYYNDMQGLCRSIHELSLRKNNLIMSEKNLTQIELIKMYEFIMCLVKYKLWIK